jgi:hypothetical protein
MINTQSIKEALKDGAEASMICMTCPWDRLCLTPPTMTKADIENTLEQMAKKSEESGGDSFQSMLMGTLIFAGKDDAATLCPILTNRFQTSDGRKIADALRKMMQEWED